MSFEILKIKSFSVKNPVMIVGLPGIGNVGKIAVDFLIEEFKAEKICDVISNEYPHAVFVNEKNLAELPQISIFKAKLGKRDVLIMTGDVQPINERSCYDFCDEVLKFLKKLGGKFVITIGGIGLREIPEKPIVYVTGSREKVVKEYCVKGVRRDIWGVVGPIIGVAGVMVGISERYNINSVCYLSQTFGHPNYIGIKGSKEVINILEKVLNFKVNVKRLNKEISKIEGELKLKTKAIKELQEKKKAPEELSYIG